MSPGNWPNVIRSAPAKAVDFFAYDAFKRALEGRSHAAHSTPAQRCLAGKCRLKLSKLWLKLFKLWLKLVKLWLELGSLRP
jgi:hypothetical protein